MKKFFAFLLTFAMLFSLAMPAMAAEPTVNGGTSGDVTASFDPDIAITGVSVTGDVVTYDADTNTYTAVIPAGEAVDEVYVVLTGTNLKYIPADDETYLWKIFNGYAEDVYSVGDDIESGFLEEDAETVVIPVGAFPELIGITYDISFSNDGGDSWSEPIHFVVKEAPIDASITGISVTGDTVTYDADTATYTIGIPVDTGSVEVTMVIRGNNLQDIPANSLTYLIGMYEVDTDGNPIVDDPNFMSFGAFATLGKLDEDTGALLRTAPVSSNQVGRTVGYAFSNSGFTGWSDIVYVTYKAAYAITVDPAIANGTVTAKGYAVEGETVELLVSAAKGYELDTLTVKQGETVVEVAADHTFTMPAGDVTVTATFKTETAKYTVTIAEDIENGTVTVNNPQESYHAGDDVTLTVAPDEGYELESLTISYVDENGQIQNVTYTDTYTFTMPASAVNVSATFKYTGPYDITVNESDNGRVTANLDEATAGTTVTLTVTPADDYELDTLKVNDGAVEVTKGDDDTYTFAMPEADVTVSATFKKIPHSITIAETENGTVTSDKQTATEGETVTLTVTPATGYQIDSVTVTDAEGNTVDFTETGVASGTYKFTMPASNVTVAATFKKLPVTSVAITWGSMAFTYDDTIADGATEENGWTCEAGANNIVVENTGETTFTAQAAYASYEGYESISGSFNPASKELAIGEKYTFTLELSGKPTKVLSGDKIGKVTVTIEEYDPVYLNFSFASADGMTYKKHKIEFFDASDASISVTEPSTETTNTVAVPSNAVTFQILVDYSSTLNGMPIAHNWEYYGSSKIDVPAETSNVVVAMPVNYTITTVQ